MKKGLKTAIKVVVSFALIGYLVWKLGPLQLLKVMSGFKLWLLPIVLAIFVLNSFFGGLNIQLMLLAFKKKLPYFKTLGLFLRAWAYGLFLPSKLGEFSLIVFLKKEGVEYSQGLIISLIDKLITLFVLFALSFAGIAKLIGLKNALIAGSVLIGLALIGASFLFSEIGKKIIKRLAFRWLHEVLSGFTKNLVFLLKKRKRFLLLNAGVTLIKWLLVVVMVQVILIGLGVHVNFFSIMIAVTLGILASLVPVSISGLGVTENVAVEVFSYYGVPSIPAGSAMLLVAIIKYLQALIILWIYQ